MTSRLSDPDPEPAPARPLAPLQDPEDFAHAALAHIDEVVYIVRRTEDPLGGTVEYVSERARQITGFEPAAFRTDPALWFRLLHPEDVPAVQASTLRMLETRQGCTRVYRLRNAQTGEYLWIEDRIAPILDARGAITGLVGAARDVTDRKRTEEALRLSEERFRTVVDSMNDIVFVLDREQRHVAVLGRWLERYGFAPKSFLGKSAAELLGPAAARVHEAANRRALAGEPVVYEWSAEGPEGERCFQTSLAPLRDANGEVSGITGVGREITALKRAENAVRENEERLRAQFKGIPIPTFCWRRAGDDFVLSDYNAAADAFTGGKVSQFRGTTARAMFPDVPEIPDDLERCFAERTPIRRQMVHRLRTTGEVRSLWVTYGFVPPDTILVHTQDVSEQMRAQAALQESRRRLQALFDNTLDAILLADDAARYVDVNPAACALVGYSREELLRLTVWDITPVPSRERGQELWRQFIAAGTQAGEYIVHRKDGTTREIEYRAVANILPGLHLSVLRDITARKRAQEALGARAREQAAVARLGQRALAGVDNQTLMSEAVALVAETLGVEYSKVLELLPDGRALLLRAGVGWREGLVGHATVGSGSGSQAGFTLRSGVPVVVHDLRGETRFEGPPLLRDHEVVSGMSVAIHGDERPFGVLGAHTTKRRDFTADDVHFLESIAHVLASAVLRKRQEVVRGQLLERVISIQEAERRHLARELHDDVGQVLTGLKLMLETCDKGVCDAGTLVVNDLVARVRDLSLSLRPAILDDLGLVPALLWLFDRYTVQMHVRVDFQHSGVSRRFPQEIETAVFRIVQEALTNAARHAGVREVGVQVWAQAERLGARIEDHGCGFDVAGALAGSTAGLAGMRERAELLGGQLTIESAPGSGARLSVELPLASETDQ